MICEYYKVCYVGQKSTSLEARFNLSMFSFRGKAAVGERPMDRQPFAHKCRMSCRERESSVGVAASSRLRAAST